MYEGHDFTYSHSEAAFASYTDASGLRGTTNPFKEGYAEPPKIDVARSVQNLADMASLAVRGLVDDPNLRIDPVSAAEQENFRGIKDRRYGNSPSFGEVPYPPKVDPKNVNDIYKNPDGYISPSVYRARLFVGKNMIEPQGYGWTSPVKPVILSNYEPIRTHSMQGRDTAVYGEVFARIDSVMDQLNDPRPLIAARGLSGWKESALSLDQIENIKEKLDSGARHLIDRGHDLIPVALRISYRNGDEAPDKRSNGVYIPVSPGLDHQNRPFKIGHVNGVPEIQLLSAGELYQAEKDIKQFNDRLKGSAQGK